MTLRLALVVGLSSATLFASDAARARGQSQVTPSFRARSIVVSVDVSVRRGNNPVSGLTAEDFVLTDHGVQQEVEVVDVQDIPVDVSLVVDLSGSTSGRLDQYRSDVLAIARLIRPADQLRVITFSSRVDQLLPLSPNGTLPPVARMHSAGASSVYDGVAAALIRPVGVDRRHLIVAFTDGQENTSFLTLDDLMAVAQRSEAVIHLSRSQNDAMTAVAEATGGTNHGNWIRRSMLGTFADILDAFRQSYVLRYRPTGVPTDGWHAITVTVKRPGRYDIRTRRGYFGGLESDAGRREPPLTCWPLGPCANRVAIH
jgi:hypothetical protein